METNPDVPDLSTQRNRIVGLVIASWILAFMPFYLAGLSLTAGLLAIFWVYHWRSALPLVALLLHPTVGAFFAGVANWSSPRPSVVGMGLPGAGFFDLHPEIRCYRQTGGCVVNGSEWVLDVPRNLGLEFMIAVAGLPPRTYHGPYPTKEEALRLTETAAESPPSELPLGNIQVEGRGLELGAKFGENLVRDLGMIDSLDFEEEALSKHPVRVRVVSVEGQCLLLRVDRQTPSRFSPASGPVDVIVLIDMVTLKPFACYAVAGQLSRVPRILSPQFTASH